jgi:hypothetical protein
VVGSDVQYASSELPYGIPSHSFEPSIIGISAEIADAAGSNGCAGSVLPRLIPIRRLPQTPFWRPTRRLTRSDTPAYSDYAHVNESGTPSAPQIQVVLHWFEDLKQRVPRP